MSLNLTQREKRFLGLLFAFGGVVVILSGLIAVMLPSTTRQPADPTEVMLKGSIVFWVAVFVARYPLVALHELGHFAAGKLVHMKLVYFQVGPFAAFFSPSGTSVRRIGSWFDGSGACGMIPISGGFRPTNTAILIAGGPITSILTAIALVLLMRSTVDWGHIDPTTFTLRQFALGGATLVALVCVVNSVIPRRYRGMRTDASYLCGLARPATAQKIADLFGVIAEIHTRKRPRDWNRAGLDAVIAGAEGPAERLTANIFGFYHYWDSGERERAASLIAAAAAECDKPAFIELNQKLALYDHAFALALQASDLQAARAAFDKGASVNSGPLGYIRDRAAAAIALAEGDTRTAAEKANAACAEIRRDNKVVTPDLEAEIEWNEEIIAAAKELMPPLRG